MLHAARKIVESRQNCEFRKWTKYYELLNFLSPFIRKMAKNLVRVMNLESEQNITKY